MNLVLLKLVEYLGHTNALISGLAYDEVGVYCAHLTHISLIYYRSKRYLTIHISQQ